MTRALTIDETARRARDVLLLTLAALCSCVLAKLLVPADVEVAIIPTLGALAVRHFRHGNQDQHEPKHPAVKFLVAAWNEGDFSKAEKYVAPDCAVFMNGFAPELGPEESGPALAEESIEYWRAMVPDIRMELTQEIRAGDGLWAFAQQDLQELKCLRGQMDRFAAAA